MAQAAGGFDLQRSLNYLKVKITGETDKRGTGNAALR
jgi:hypothetical protein